jgi:hypothetical protein
MAHLGQAQPAPQADLNQFRPRKSVALIHDSGTAASSPPPANLLAHPDRSLLGP